MKKSSLKQKEDTLQLRQQILDVVAEHQPITSFQIAKRIACDVFKVSPCCKGLLTAGALIKGEEVLSEYQDRKNTKTVPTYLLGENPTADFKSKQYKYPVRQKESVAPEEKPEPITDEDMEWMRYWRKRHQQRYGQQENVYDSLTL